MVRVIDDAELLRLAAEPPRDVAPALRRSHWFLPLVALVAAVPPVLTAVRAPFTEESACWGLRALSVRFATRLTHWLAPETGWSEATMAWAPPLQAWLTAPLLPLWEPGRVMPLIAVACVSAIGSVALVYRFADETGGPRWALLSAVCLALHPQVLIHVQTAAPYGLNFLLLVVATWGLWGHLNGGTDLVSLRLLMAGVAWGLLLLAGGPLALAFVGVGTLWVLWSHVCCDPPQRARFAATGMSWPASLTSLGLMIGTGGALGCWWLAMMFAEHGVRFLGAWLIGQSGPMPLPWNAGTPGQIYLDWLHRAAFLSGWWVVGVVSAVRLGCSRWSSPEAQLSRWLVTWMAAAACLRFALFALGVRDPGVIGLWETFALLPATLLAAQGLDRVLRRDASWQLLLTALMVTVGHVCWMLTGAFSVGVIVGGTFGLLVLASAPLALGLRRSTLAWSETEIRRWIAAAALVTLCGNAILGWQLTYPPTDRAAWQRLRNRLAAVGDVSQVSLVTSRRTASPQLRYLVQALWPHCEFSQASGWDPKLTETLVRERGQPRSRLLVIEWTRQDLRLQGDVGSGWQISTVLEPEPYRGMRLAAHLLAPVPR